MNKSSDIKRDKCLSLGNQHFSHTVRGGSNIFTLGGAHIFDKRGDKHYMLEMVVDMVVMILLKEGEALSKAKELLRAEILVRLYL